MGLTLADSYYLKAKAATDAYCNDWEEACEALNYALSYDENHIPSLCLLGEIYAIHLSSSEMATSCFDKVIAIDPLYERVYYTYLKHLIHINKIEKAKKLLKFALTIETINMARIKWLSSIIEENLGNYSACLEHLKEAKKYSYNVSYFDFMVDEQKRIEKKMKLGKSQTENKKSKKKKKTKKK